MINQRLVYRHASQFLLAIRAIYSTNALKEPSLYVVSAVQLHFSRTHERTNERTNEEEKHKRTLFQRGVTSYRESVLYPTPNGTL